MTWLKHFQAVFGLGDDSRVADLEAWIVRGDEGAFARLGGRAAKKKADWHNLGAHGFFELKDPLTRMRALKLVRTVRDGEALVAWLARDADSAWLTAYLTARSVELKQAPPERITGWQPHLRKQSALLQFLRSIESTMGDRLAAGPVDEGLEERHPAAVRVGCLSAKGGIEVAPVDCAVAWQSDKDCEDDAGVGGEDRGPSVWRDTAAITRQA